MLLRYIQEGVLAYSSLVMLISRTVTQDKKAETDFSYFNIRMAKFTLEYPLLKDIFLVLASSTYEVMSVLGLKDAFHSLRLSKLEKILWNAAIFCSASYLYQRMPTGLDKFPSIWQSYINTILYC